MINRTDRLHAKSLGVGAPVKQEISYAAAELENALELCEVLDTGPIRLFGAYQDRFQQGQA